MNGGTEELLTGIVEHSGLYESSIGVRDRCIVFVRAAAEERRLVFDADVRDHLPTGRRVQLRVRPSPDEGTVTLLDRKLL